jgi:hypothetical protein
LGFKTSVPWVVVLVTLAVKVSLLKSESFFRTPFAAGDGERRVFIGVVGVVYRHGWHVEVVEKHRDGCPEGAGHREV